MCVCVWSPCLHLFQCAGFIVSEHLFDKGLEGFEMNFVSLSLFALCLILVWKLKMKTRKSLSDLKQDVLGPSPTSPSADSFMTQSDHVTIQIRGWYVHNRPKVTCHSVSKSYQVLTLTLSKTFWRFFIPTWSYLASFTKKCHLELKASHQERLNKIPLSCLPFKTASFFWKGRTPLFNEQRGKKKKVNHPVKIKKRSGLWMGLWARISTCISHRPTPECERCAHTGTWKSIQTVSVALRGLL